jgi:hypothetical protein
MKLSRLFKPFFILLLVASLSANAALSYYQFGDWQNIPEWDLQIFGYSFSSAQNSSKTSFVFSKLDALTGQYVHLAEISKDINHQFNLLRSDIEQIEGTAELTRETILKTGERLSILQSALENKSNALMERDKELKQRDLVLAEKEQTILEAEKVIKNQLRQLKASPTLRMDNDAYILQHEFNRLGQSLSGQENDLKFIQTTLRKGIVSLSSDLLFESQDSDQLSSIAVSFLGDFSKSMAYLPNATIEIIQLVGLEGSISDSLSSKHSAAVGAELLKNGLPPESMIISSKPNQQIKPQESSYIELHVNI